MRAQSDFRKVRHRIEGNPFAGRKAAEGQEDVGFVAASTRHGICSARADCLVILPWSRSRRDAVCA